MLFHIGLNVFHVVYLMNCMETEAAVAQSVGIVRLQTQAMEFSFLV
jgi:hypothetical protein